MGCLKTNRKSKKEPLRPEPKLECVVVLRRGRRVETRGKKLTEPHMMTSFETVVFVENPRGVFVAYRRKYLSRQGIGSLIWCSWGRCFRQKEPPQETIIRRMVQVSVNTRTRSEHRPNRRIRIFSAPDHLSLLPHTTSWINHTTILHWLSRGPRLYSLSSSRFYLIHLIVCLLLYCSEVVDTSVKQDRSCRDLQPTLPKF